MSRRPTLDALATATEHDALTRGLVSARVRLLQQSSERADMLDQLARGMEAGTIEPRSAQVEALRQMAATLRVLGCAEAAALAVETRPPVGLWGRVRWLLWG